MLFSPGECSLTLHDKNKFQISVKYKENGLEHLVLSKKVSFFSRATEGAHAFYIKDTLHYLDRKKYHERICQLTLTPAKLNDAVLKALSSISNENDLCLFIKYTLCLNLWNDRIITLYNQNKESHENYGLAMGLKHYLSEYISQFGRLHSEFQYTLEWMDARVITPLLHETRRTVQTSNRLLCVHSAAAKGRAFTQAVSAMISLENDQSILEPTNRHNHVILLPEQDCVFKQSDYISREEERLIQSLFDLSMSNGVVPSFDFVRLGSCRFGHLQLSHEDYERSYAIFTCNPLFREALAARLKTQKELDLWCKMRHDYRKQDSLTINYSRYARCFFDVFENGRWSVINFQRFKYCHENDRFQANTLVKYNGDTGIKTMLEFLDDQGLQHALRYDHYLNLPDHALFVPVLPTDEFRRIYEKMEKIKWEYRDGDRWFPATFKELQALWITREIDDTTEVCVSDGIDSFTIGRENKQLRETLDVRWSLFLSSTKVKKKKSFDYFHNPTARPFVNKMYLFKDLDYEEQFFSQMLNRLDKDSVLMTLLTAEFQLLDLHPSNIGITINPINGNEVFLKKEYLIFNEFIDFFTLLKNYLNGKISSTSTIGIKKSQTEIDFYKLEELPQLMDCLESSWRLQLFDTDLSLGESNLAHTFSIDYGKPTKTLSHLIPLRCDLLCTSWRDKPLSLDLLKKWIKPQRIKRIRDWVNFEDAPVKKLIPKQLLAGFYKKIEEYINEASFSLSHHKEMDKEKSVEEIRRLFSIELANLEKYETFWIMMEKCLVLKSEGYYRDLCLNYNKRLRIAGQFFPRLTFLQRKALFERQDNVRDYIHYVELMNEQLERQDKLQLIEEIISCPAIPFSSEQRETFAKHLIDIKTVSEETIINNFFIEIKKRLIPTYFNICKSMYPLLADVYALVEFYEQNMFDAGRAIGNYLQPIEIFIEEGKKENDEKIKKLALSIENRIKAADKSFKAYFGNFENDNKGDAKDELAARCP